MSLVVLDPGLASRVVDLGRPRSRSLGVPVGGAADAACFVLGNGLVGNPPDAPGLEVTLKGPILRAEAQIGCVVFGAPFEMGTARQTLKAGRTFTLEAGEELHIGGATRGMRAYLCVAGGFEANFVLGSRSALQTVQRGERLSCSASRLGTRYLSEDPFPAWSGALHCLCGLQAGWFETEEFYAREFTVSPALNRMGIRLQGAPLTTPARELVSEPVAPGAVQVTRDGQCILLGIDGQTIGGYPKIAQVIQADLDRLGQLRPGEKVRFTLVDHAQARRCYLERLSVLAEWTKRLQLGKDVFL